MQYTIHFLYLMAIHVCIYIAIIYKSVSIILFSSYIIHCSHTLRATTGTQVQGWDAQISHTHVHVCHVLIFNPTAWDSLSLLSINNEHMSSCKILKHFLQLKIQKYGTSSSVGLSKKIEHDILPSKVKQNG